METQTPDFETLPLRNYTERAYLDYSMYVINDRALPHVADGWYWTAVEHVGVTSFSRVVLLPRAGRPHFYDGSYLVLVVRDTEK